MNIQRICNAQFNIKPIMSRADNQKPQFGLRMAAPLGVDTVSFKCKANKAVSKEIKAALARKEARAIRDARQLAEAKKAAEKNIPTKKNLSGEERTRGVSISTARQIHDMVVGLQRKIDVFMDRIFEDMLVNQLAPKNIILKMSGRAKTPISIMEKSATRDWNSIDEILNNMTDLNGRKIVFNYKTGKEDAENAIDRLIPLIKTKQILLKEIELQRPKAIEGMTKKEQEEYDYVSKVFLDKLEDAQEEVMNGTETEIDKIKLIDRPLPKYTKGNYCALHLLLQINEKGARPFELQIMGAREDTGKLFDDKRFKKFDGKEVDKMYAPLISLWERLLPEENAAAKERFLQYCKDANLQLREDELQEYKTQRLINRSNGLFMSVRNYGLPPEYDLNYQYELMRKCEKDARHKKEIKEIKKQIEKTQTKKSEVDKFVADMTKEKLQELVAKYSPKTVKTGKDKVKVK